MGSGGSGSISCLGMTFSCVRTVGEAQLTASQMGVPWMSSHQAHGNGFDAEDWQAVSNQNPYEATKFQMDLIRTEPSRRRVPSEFATSRLCASFCSAILFLPIRMPLFAGQVVWFFGS